MNTQNQIQPAASFLARTMRALRKLSRDRRGVEMVEVLVVISIFALGGIAAMRSLAGKVDTAAQGAGDKVINAVK